MGVIKNQSIKSTIITYIGFIVGAVNMIFVMPQFFSSAQIGLIQVFIAFATQMVTIGGLGMAVVTNKFTPYYKAHLQPKHRDLLTIILTVGTIGMLLVLGLAFLNSDFIIRKFSKNSPLFVQYLNLFPLFTMGYFYYYILESFNNNNQFTVWSAFVRELFYRFFNLFAALLFAIGWLTFSGVINLYMAMYWLGAMLLAANLYYNKLFYIPLKISKLTKRLKRNISQYALSVWGTSILGVTFQFVDTFAIAGLVGLSQAAIYSVAKFIISPIVIPSNSVITISAPLISEAWRQNNKNKIEEIYKKTALVLVLICGFAFFLIWCNSQDILHLVPHKFYGSETAIVEAQIAILILGLARLADFSTSVNSHILQNSRKYYLVDMLINISSVILSIPLNYFLIKHYGIIGAALAFLSLSVLANSVKAIFLYWKENLHPFSAKWIPTLVVFGIMVITHFGIEYIFKKNGWNNFQSIPSLLLILSIRSLFLCAIFIPMVYWLNISDDITKTIQSVLTKIKMIVKK